MNMREQFEARFPVPDGVQWSEEHQNYGWIKKTAFQRTLIYRSLWTGWRALSEQLEVNLRPPHNDYGNYADSEVAGAAKYYEQAVAAIEAAGVKVKP